MRYQPLAALSLLALAACAGRQPLPPGRQPPPAAEIAQGPSHTLLPAAPSARLLDPGREPRHVLRYRLPAARSEQMITVLSVVASATAANGVQIPTPSLPTRRIVTAVTVSPLPGDLMALHARMTDADAIPASDSAGTAVPERFRNSVRKLIGMTTDARIDARGVTLETKTTTPPNTTLSERFDDGINSLGDQIVVLPVEPIGEGARWEVTRRSRKQGMTVHETTRYDLREVNGSGLNLGVTTQLAAPTADDEVESFRGSGSGSILLEPDKLLARSSQMTLDLELTPHDQSLASLIGFKVGIEMQARR